jgi:DNA repair protein RecO (recombination protein O)
MALAADRCVCLRKFEYSETSQILTLFSRTHGLIRVIAKGAHRKTKAGASKFGGGIDLLDTGHAVFTNAPERDLAILTEWQLLDGRLELRRDLRKVYLGLYCAELVTMLIEEHDAHLELFDRLEQVLTDLATPKIEESFLAFELDLLREAGYLPELEICGICSTAARDDRVYFSPSLGSVICRNCEASSPDRMEIDLRLLRMVQTMLRLPRIAGSPQRLPRLTRHQTDPINRILAAHVEHTLSKRLRMNAYVLGKKSTAARAVSV